MHISNLVMVMKNKILEKRGDSSIFQIIICITILTFMLFFPVFTFSYYKFKNTGDAIGLDVVQAASTRGGVDEEVLALLENELIDQGYSFDGNIIKQGDGGEELESNPYAVRVYTNVPLVTEYNLKSGDGIIPVYSLDKLDGYHSDIDLWNQSGPATRRDRTMSEKDRVIKVVICMPVATHSKMINKLYALLSVKGTTEGQRLSETAPYVVQYTTISEWYDTSKP